MQIWIISGEASGDDYGAGLARELRRLVPDVVLKGMGAEKMRQAGVELLVDSTDLGVVGFMEVVRHLPFFLRLLGEMTRRAAEARPDAVVLIDYPGFNIRYAERLKALGIPVVYYISPQVWAWKKGRIPKIAAAVTRMLCIFPFEPEVYAGTGLDARFVGHPLLETLSPLTSVPAERDPNLVILLPGSRHGEFSRLLPAYMETARELHRLRPELRFHLPMRNAANVETAKTIIAKTDPTFDLGLFTFSTGDARQWMRRGAAGIAASGTVTVEAAILGLPLVVTYRLHPLTWWFAKRVVKLPSITIANLVTKRTVYAERLQDEATAEHLAPALLEILPSGQRHQDVQEGMADCVRQLGGERQAAANVAENVLEVIAQRR